MDVLVHVGYHKTGSNWLRLHLWPNADAGFGWVGKHKTHPVRRLVEDRPLEFDADELRHVFEPMLRPIADAGLQPVVSYERLCGHPVSGGFDSKEIAERLAAVFPGGRILMVIREQRSMIVSAYKEYVRQGGAAGIGAFLEPKHGNSLVVPAFDFRYFEYEHLIRLYRELFPERLLVLPYEQFVADGPGFVESIAAFAGRPLTDEQLAALPYAEQVNSSREGASLEEVRQRNLGKRSVLNPVKSETPLEPQGDLRGKVDEAVADRYRASNRATAELTGLDLGAYGWPV